uniref:Uncharacterized protein n=1 Tax=Rhizophora mucronata TaxID=61149 RepID=A0A2P2R3J0_RHIMU
MYRVLLLF